MSEPDGEPRGLELAVPCRHCERTLLVRVLPDQEFDVPVFAATRATGWSWSLDGDWVVCDACRGDGDE